MFLSHNLIFVIGQYLHVLRYNITYQNIKEGTNLINRAQLKGIVIQNIKLNPGISFSTSMPVTKAIQISIFAYLFGMASINGLYPFALSFMAANFLYRRDYIVAGIFSFLGTLTAMRSIVSLRYLGAMGIFLLICNLLTRINRQNEFRFGLTIFFQMCWQV